MVLLDGDEASERLARSIHTASRVFWGRDWIDTHLSFTTLTDPHTGEVLDANDALVSGLLSPGWLLKQTDGSTPDANRELEVAS